MFPLLNGPQTCVSSHRTLRVICWVYEGDVNMFEQSIRGLLAQVEAGRIVLPAMQRPFVWEDDRIYKLVDSLLRRFPLGTVLMWKTSTMQRYRHFRKDVDPAIAQVFTYESSASGDRYLVLDGQQRLTSLLIALKGTYGGRRLYLDTLSGNPEGKDPGDTYFDCWFFTENEAREHNEKHPGTLYMPLRTLTEMSPEDAPGLAFKKSQELKLSDAQYQRLSQTYLRCAAATRSEKALQVHLIDGDAAAEPTPVEEILEIFVRVNSGGLVLNKSDLLMSLLDLAWNDIQPELLQAVRDINLGRPFSITRDDVLKSLLLAVGSDTRFDRLVSDRDRVEKLATLMDTQLPAIKKAWQLLTAFLTDECRIGSERFFRGGHNSLLPFVMWFFKNPTPTPSQKRALRAAVYITIMSGVFAGAEARMGNFTRKEAMVVGYFPIASLAKAAKANRGISSLDDLLRRHLDLTLNIAHGGVTLNNNPEELQRDHIFPKSTLLKEGRPDAEVNHYANFHFLRGTDNLNKSDTPPHVWFKSPGKDVPAYSDDDLAERLLRWELLEPDAFDAMIAERSQRIREQAEKLFGMKEKAFNALF
jgi:hypothetical protein